MNNVETKVRTVHFSIGENMGELLSQIAREHFMAGDIEKAIDSITKSLRCEKDIAISVILGKKTFGTDVTTGELYLKDDKTGFNLLKEINQTYSNEKLSYMTSSIEDFLNECYDNSILSTSKLYKDLFDRFRKIIKKFEIAYNLLSFTVEHYPKNYIIACKLLYVEKVRSIIDHIVDFFHKKLLEDCYVEYVSDIKTLKTAAIVAIPSERDVEIEVGYILKNGYTIGSEYRYTALEHIRITNAICFFHDITEEELLDESVLIRGTYCFNAPHRKNITVEQFEELKRIARKNPNKFLINQFKNKEITFDELKKMSYQDFVKENSKLL